MQNLKELVEYLKKQGYKNLAKIFKKEPVDKSDNFWDKNIKRMEDIKES